MLLLVLLLPEWLLPLQELQLSQIQLKVECGCRSQLELGPPTLLLLELENLELDRYEPAAAATLVVAATNVFAATSSEAAFMLTD